ncbi:hypothetical protein [Mesorhizobium sp. WSM2239]|uniref:Uncharacterized protein n=2 Tax=unclassified Mesorhizobium TaxID=325217 RepID=A0AAU8D206_9HYPH
MNKDVDLKPVEAWAVLSRHFKDEPFSLEKAVMYPPKTDREWLERQWPGRVVLVRIIPLPASPAKEAKP